MLAAVVSVARRLYVCLNLDVLAPEGDIRDLVCFIVAEPAWRGDS